MRKLFLATLASTLLFGAAAPLAAQANGEYFVDQEQIGEWSEDYVNVLVELGVLEGYPDGTFKPAANITREEFSVALMKGLIVLEERLLTEQYAADEYLYNEIVNLQSQLFVLFVSMK